MGGIVKFMGGTTTPPMSAMWVVKNKNIKKVAINVDVSMFMKKI